MERYRAFRLTSSGNMRSVRRRRGQCGDPATRAGHVDAAARLTPPLQPVAQHFRAGVVGGVEPRHVERDRRADGRAVERFADVVREVAAR